MLVVVVIVNKKVIASVDTYVRFAEAVNRLDLQQTELAGLQDLQETVLEEVTTGAVGGRGRGEQCDRLQRPQPHTDLLEEARAAARGARAGAGPTTEGGEITMAIAFQRTSTNYLQPSPSPSGLADVVDLILDKG